MKKTLLMLSLGAIIFVTGCNNSGDNQMQQGQKPAPARDSTDYWKKQSDQTQDHAKSMHDDDDMDHTVPSPSQNGSGDNGNGYHNNNNGCCGSCGGC